MLVGAGDIANCDLPGDEATARLLDGIPGTVFTAGDNAYPSGTPSSSRTATGRPGAASSTGHCPLARQPRLGDRQARRLLGYFGARAHPNGTSWYSTTSARGTSSSSTRSAARSAAAAPTRPRAAGSAPTSPHRRARCTLAIWHKPRWSSGTHGNDRGVAPFWERSTRPARTSSSTATTTTTSGSRRRIRRATRTGPAGIREFVVGTGGAELRDFGRIAANSELRIGGYAGVFKLTLKTDGYDWAFVPATGEVTDAGTAHCH